MINLMTLNKNMNKRHKNSHKIYKKINWNKILVKIWKKKQIKVYQINKQKMNITRIKIRIRNKILNMKTAFKKKKK